VNQALIINPPFMEPHRPPISSAILAEIFRLKGYEVSVLDLNIELFHAIGGDMFYDVQSMFTNNICSKEQNQYLIEFNNRFLNQKDLEKYEYIAISCFSYWNLKMVEFCCRQIRGIYHGTIIVGGAGLELDDFGKKLRDQQLIDHYIYGEAELALPKLLDGVENYPGINGNPPEQIDDIEDLPLPNYGYFDLKRYDWLLDKPDVFIYGSRGCVRKCTFCDVEHYWPKFRWRTGKSIANEMIANYEKYGISNYFFADSLVNGNLKEFTIFCDTLVKYKPDLFRWAGYAIVRPKEHHPAEMFDMIKEAGGRFWSLGIETGVDRIRYEMKKKFTNDDVDWHLEQSQRIGLQNLFLMIPTWPSETSEEHLEYLKIFERWQNYAVDGTIYGINISATLGINETSPLSKSEGIDFEFPNIDYIDKSMAKPIMWVSRSQPTLTHKEKFQRTLNLYKEVIKYNWPLVNRKQKLRELEASLISVLSELRIK
jgi:radical SAM superfamily enzyme YgiQ (UPF0313 family)